MNDDDDGSEGDKVHYKITCRKQKSPSKLLFKISESHVETNYCSNHCPVTNENHYGITLIIMYKNQDCSITVLILHKFLQKVGERPCPTAHLSTGGSKPIRESTIVVNGQGPVNSTTGHVNTGPKGDVW